MKTQLLVGIALLTGMSCMGQFVGIGTDMPLSGLHVKGGGVLVEGSIGSTPLSGAGTRLMWVPASGAFRAGQATGTYWNHDSLGSFSAAFGRANRAIGSNSFSTGEGNVSRLSASATFGYYNNALGANAAAFGVNTTASGFSSFSMGYYTQTKAQASLAIGAYNNIVDNPNPVVMDPLDRVFQVGNGVSNATRSNAFTVLRNGNVGIGVLNPITSLHTDGGIFSVGDEDAAFINGTGVRFMWLPKKYSLRAGRSSFLSWEADSVGNGSTAFGFDNRAVGEYSFAGGSSSAARGSGSFAYGFQTEANKDYAMALGRNSIANNHSAIALGYFLVAKALGGVAVGSCNDITDTPPANALLSTDRVFQVGNGSVYTARSNALTILRNGNVGIGVLVPTEKLQVTGNAIISGTATVSGNGVVTGTSSKVQKIVVTSVAVNIPNMAVDATAIIPFSWSETFSEVPVAYVGNVTLSSPGGFAECDFTLVSISSSGGWLYIHNTKGGIHTKGFSINVIGMGSK